LRRANCVNRRTEEKGREGGTGRTSRVDEHAQDVLRPGGDDEGQLEGRHVGDWGGREEGRAGEIEKSIVWQVSKGKEILLVRSFPSSYPSSLPT